MFKDKKQIGLISALATFALLVIISMKTNVVPQVIWEVFLLITGRVNEILPHTVPSFLMMFPIILATVAVKLPFSILAAISQTYFLDKHGEHAISNSLDEMKEGHHFRDFFILVLIEELLARALFLGFLTKLPLLDGVAGFYLLFFLGNAFWALLHLANFKEEKDRHPLRVLPQFLGGIFFTYIYVKYGLLATVLTHFASNAVLFATHRVQNINEVDLLITGYASFTAFSSYYLMSRPISEVMPWFQNNPVYVLPGWEMMDYLKFSVFVTSTLMAVFSLLLYDRGEAGKKHPGIFESIAGFPFVILLVYLMFNLLGIFCASMAYRVLIIAILLTFAHKGASGSAMTRTFWVFLPDAYISICVIEALDFWPCLMWLTLETIIHIPRAYLTQYDD